MSAPRPIAKLQSVRKLGDAIDSWRIAIEYVIEDVIIGDDANTTLMACAIIADRQVESRVPAKYRRYFGSWADLAGDAFDSDLCLYRKRLRRMARIADAWQPDVPDCPN